MTTSKPILKAAAWAASVLPASLKRLLYKIPFLSKLIRISLNAAAPDGLTNIEISAGPARGLRMALDLHAEKDYWLGTYEPDLQATVENLIQPGYTIYDVGANIGYISLMCSRLTGTNGSVFSFEALPLNIKRLTQNVKMNNLLEIITVTHTAVVDKKGEVTFLTHTSGAMGKAEGSAGRHEKYGNSITIPGISLDDFAFSRGNKLPDLIKMDIEGGEGNALKGAKKILSNKKPVLLIELHGEEAARQVWDSLNMHNYSIHELKRGYPQVSSVGALGWKAYIVAVAETQSALLT